MPDPLTLTGPDVPHVPYPRPCLGSFRTPHSTHALTLMKRTLQTRRQMLQQSAGYLAAALVPSALGSAKSFAADTVSSSRFRIGIVDWELTKATDPEAITLAAQLGFDGVQVDLGDLEAIKKPDLQDRYAQLSRKYRVQVASLALGKLSDSPYGTDPKGQALVDAAIDVAKAIGQKILLLAFFGKNGMEQPENKFDTLVGRLKEIAPKAEKNGVILGIEGETTAEKYRELIDRVGSPAVKVYFDTVHAHQPSADIFKEIALLGSRICEFHAKDYGNILFGQGSIDFKAVHRAMDAINYRGWIQVEQWGEVKGAKPFGFEETHRRNLKYLREVFRDGNG